MSIKIYSYKTIATLPILLLACITEPQGCGLGFSEIDERCYQDNDLEVLQDFINNSAETIPMTWDADTNGTIEPLELGKQRWNENGR